MKLFIELYKGYRAVCTLSGVSAAINSAWLASKAMKFTIDVGIDDPLLLDVAMSCGLCEMTIEMGVTAWYSEDGFYVCQTCESRENNFHHQSTN